MTRTVVVVDDEPGLRRLLRLLLDRDGGFTVLAEAADGVAALEAVRTHDPDLLLLDLGLPGLDGLEVLEQLQGQPRPATVVLTGFTDETTHARACELGAAACLVKGTDFHRVVPTLHEVATSVG
ncbi:response regulator [Nitriliruptor alkaliphilus]|uniref:response regulator n=1 Tax=Nitriliruptor alkaliphilus TaxID=427918 RepID=UPI0006989331|nr:response regulator [Nitriliruptor alkaliphilus]